MASRRARRVASSARIGRASSSAGSTGWAAAASRHCAADRTAWLTASPQSHSSANRRASAGSWASCAGGSPNTSRSMSERGNSSPRP
ncbi:hypothetical protein G6F66_014684 [Rhizopus arrhizus]|nr:hypothetical protein G6F66_014684 [Rhizopus arrhizus]